VLFLEGGSMIDITKDIQSLTTFRRRSGDFMKQLKKTKRPVVLTIKGKAAAIVQDAEAYQRLLDIAALADAREGIRQGLEQANRGEGRPVREFFAEFEAAHGIRRSAASHGRKPRLKSVPPTGGRNKD
jgi:prevent-host-death family protein